MAFPGVDAGYPSATMPIGSSREGLAGQWLSAGVSSETGSLLAALSPDSRIIVLRALQLGDLLCALPAFRALRFAMPRARITLVGLPWAAQYVVRYPELLDGFIAFPGFPGLPEQELHLQRIPAFIERIQRERFDLALQMQGSGEISNLVTALFGARRLAGFYLPGQYCPDSSSFLPYPQQDPEIWRHLRLLHFLGAPPQGDHLEFPILPQDKREAQALLPPGAEENGYVCIHAGARSESRRWPVERFAAVADWLTGLGLRVVLTGSTAEASLAAELAEQMRHPAAVLAGKTSLGVLAALLAGARMLVSNDTGVSHMAAAVHTPSVILFSASDPNRWAPLDRVRHRVVTHAGSHTAEEVIAEIETHLREVYSNAY